MAKFRSILCALAICAAFSGTAHAGPIELFDGIAIDPSQPMTLLASYMYGGTGMFISNDGAQTFSMLCMSAINTNIEGNYNRMAIGGADVIYIGAFSGLWRGDKNGCGFQEVPELDKQYVTSIATDPIDAKRTYAVTGTGASMMNGIYVNDGSTISFKPYGTQENLFVNTLNVVKTATGRRFYETVFVDQTMTTDAGITDKPLYSVRYSDDEAMTWTTNEVMNPDQWGMPDPHATFSVIAVDPTNPNQIVAAVTRDPVGDTPGSTDLIYNPMAGMPGAWKKIGTVTGFQAYAFKPDGSFYYGDSDQTTPGMYAVDKLGDQPKQLSNNWQVGCLGWDASHTRMYACHEWQFGTVDLTSGAFSIMLDMRKATQFVSCPGQNIQDLCQAQLLNAYCGVSHYPQAPLCSGYVRPECTPDICDPMGMGGTGAVSGAAGAAGSDTVGSVTAAGSGATPAVATVTAGSAAINGSAATSTLPTVAPPKAKSGCSAFALGASSPLMLGVWLAGIGGITLRARRRSKRIS